MWLERTAQLGSFEEVAAIETRSTVESIFCNYPEALIIRKSNRYAYSHDLYHLRKYLVRSLAKCRGAFSG